MLQTAIVGIIYVEVMNKWGVGGVCDAFTRAGNRAHEKLILMGLCTRALFPTDTTRLSPLRATTLSRVLR